MNVLPQPRIFLKTEPQSSPLPRTIAGRRLVERHHVPRNAADLLAFLAGFSVEEAR